MKKLGKLTLNEMQDYVALSPQEQMTMKGGMTPYQWVYTVYTAWKIAGEIHDAIKGSGGTSQGSSIEIYGLDSAKVVGSDVYIYGLDSAKISIGSK